jgi:hypothetical protein
MDTHFHIIVKERTPGGISFVMKELKPAYTRFFNKKRGRTGSIYAARFFSKPVERKSYFIRLLRYVLQNPLKIGKSLDWTSFSRLVSFLELYLRDCLEEAGTGKNKTKKESKARMDSDEAAGLGSEAHGHEERETLIDGRFIAALLFPEVVGGRVMNKKSGESAFYKKSEIEKRLKVFIMKGLSDENYETIARKNRFEGPKLCPIPDKEAGELIEKNIRDIEDFKRNPSVYREEIKFLVANDLSLRQIERFTGASRKTLGEIAKEENLYVYS